MEHKKIIIIGAGASGKDTLVGHLKRAGYFYAVTHTTRPRRVGEVHGQDYIYTDIEEYGKLVAAGYMLESAQFATGYYGTTLEAWNKNDLFILSPFALSQLTPAQRKQAWVLYLDIPERVRRKRLEQRNDQSDATDRRIAGDRIDFRGFLDYDVRISDFWVTDYEAAHTPCLVMAAGTGHKVIINLDTEEHGTTRTFIETVV